MRFLRSLLWLVGCSAWSAPAFAGAIAVVNPGFEDLVITGNRYIDPNTGASSDYTLGDIPGWVVSSVHGTATFKPDAFYYPGGVPEGVNVAAVGDGLATRSIEQTLAATLAADTTYTLRVDVGSRLDFPSTGYLVELIAGGTTLVSDSSLSVARGTFQTDTLVFKAGDNLPELGQHLKIRLTGTSGGQADFDDVRLDGVSAAAPEPATVPMLGLGLLAAWLARRRRPAPSEIDLLDAGEGA